MEWMGDGRSFGGRRPLLNNPFFLPAHVCPGLMVVFALFFTKHLLSTRCSGQVQKARKKHTTRKFPTRREWRGGTLTHSSGGNCSTKMLGNIRVCWGWERRLVGLLLLSFVKQQLFFSVGQFQPARCWECTHNIFFGIRPEREWREANILRVSLTVLREFWLAAFLPIHSRARNASSFQKVGGRGRVDQVRAVWANQIDRFELSRLYVLPRHKSLQILFREKLWCWIGTTNCSLCYSTMYNHYTYFHTSISKKKDPQ